jgi:hypothetical protein
MPAQPIRWFGNRRFLSSAFWKPPLAASPTLVRSSPYKFGKAVVISNDVYQGFPDSKILPLA